MEHDKNWWQKEMLNTQKKRKKKKKFLCLMTHEHRAVFEVILKLIPQNDYKVK